MAYYRVTATYTVVGSMLVQADSEDEAWEIADDTDLDNFKVIDVNDFSINDIRED